MPNNKNGAVRYSNYIFKELVSIIGNGYILSLFTIDFFCFEYVLPILGSFIMLYGCHLIKEHNKFFKYTYRIAFIRSITMLINFSVDWTYLHSNHTITYIQITVSAILITFLFWNLDMAFCQVCKESGITKYGHRLRQYIILYLCSLASTYLTINLGVIGAMLSLLILILNISFLLITFYQIGNILNYIETDITLSHCTVKEKKLIVPLGLGYMAVLFLMIFLSNKGTFIPVTTSDKFNTPESALTDASNRLLDLGMQKEILNDLPSSEIAYLTNAVFLTTEKSKLEVNSATLEICIYDIDCVDYHRTIIHYNWVTPPANRLYQIIECQYKYGENAMDITSGAFVTSDTSEETLKISNINLGLNNAGFPYAQHKLSNAGDDLRGYLAFSYKEGDSNKLSNRFTIYYYYQMSVFNLPYLNIQDYMDNYKSHTNSMVFDRKAVSFVLNIKNPA